VAQIGVVAVEITEQKKLEESLRSVSEKLKAEKKRGQVMTEVADLLAEKWDVRQSFPRSPLICAGSAAGICGAFLARREDWQLVRRPSISVRTGLVRNQRAARPGGRALQQRTPLIFSKDEMKALDSKVTKTLLTEGCSLMLRPVDPAQGSLGCLVLAARGRRVQHDD